ncbi:MAG: FecR domain-containing protein [Bacteroidales bacterium]|nr:FecR domain-containing protein [Candidatus Cryptobacteroides equifaecalis]
MENYFDTSTLSPEEQQDLDNVLLTLESRKLARKMNRKGYVVAAAAIAIALISILFAFTCKPEEQQFVLSTRQGVSSVMAALPDGSHLIIGPNTRMEYSSAFSPRNRAVSMTGEAYFDISRDPRHPFDVELVNCRIRVFGTKFHVSAIEGSNKVEAVLVSGAIRMDTPSGSVDVIPGTRVTYDRAKGEVSSREIDAVSYLALMEGRLKYQKVTLAELCRNLGDLYGRNIVLDEYLSSMRDSYTLSLSNRESFDDVLSALDVMVPMDIRSENETVYLTKR